MMYGVGCTKSRWRKDLTARAGGREVTQGLGETLRLSVLAVKCITSYFVFGTST
jgi:hypothetical protein